MALKMAARQRLNKRLLQDLRLLLSLLRLCHRVCCLHFGQLEDNNGVSKRLIKGGRSIHTENAISVAKKKEVASQRDFG